MKRVSVIVAAAALTMGSLPTGATAQVSPDNATDVPVLSRSVGGRTSEITSVPGKAAPKVVDGQINDWVGEITRYGGTYVYSNGELVYQDHLFDAHGADDGRDAERLALTDQLAGAVPETYRLDPMVQTVSDEFGIAGFPQIELNDSYGDATPHQDSADIEEVRVAIADDSLYLLLRTTTMTAAKSPGVLVLTDTQDGKTERAVPFNTRLSSTADHAAYLFGDSGTTTDLGSESFQDLAVGSVSTNLEGFTNAIEARIPLTALGGTPTRIAVATGPGDATGFHELVLESNYDGVPQPNIANVAFRTEEPPATWFEKQQALNLNKGTIDPFFVDLDAAKLSSAVAESFHPGPGYHDRIFLSGSVPQVVSEGSRDGLFQHYGIFLPSAYDPSPEGDATELPLQWWLHWRGGKAHTAAWVIPRMFKHFGEEKDTIVVSPSARGTSTWYVGRGHVDFLEVWADVFGSFPIDVRRVYLTGHSMGGWGSYLLGLVYPDRFAGAAPVAGPVTQGAWTGLDFPGCDNLEAPDGETPCYIPANDGRPRDQHSRKLLENARHVGYAILHGTDDELVPYSGVARQAERLVELRYRHRFYTYPGYEHYSHPIMDQWSEAATYLHSFVNPFNPARVTYKRDMPFERATEEVQAGSANGFLQFDFDSAYWMSDLTPVDAVAGTAFFDGRSLAISEQPTLAIPDAGGPTATGSTGPFVATGIAWIADPSADSPTPQNGFDIDLTGTRAVTLDLQRMNIRLDQPIAGQVSASGADLQLTLVGAWGGTPQVNVDGNLVTVQLNGDAATFTVPSGDHSVAITPTQEPSGSPSSTSSASATPTPPGPAQSSLEFVDTASAGQYTDELKLNARLTDDSGNGLQGQTLTFTLATEEGPTSVPATTDETGTAHASLVLDDRPGLGDLTVRFEGSNDYLGQADHLGFEIRKEDSALTLENQGKGSKLSLVAMLTDADSGKGIEGRTVSFEADDNVICSDAAQTAESGRTTCDVPPRYRGGHRDYEATFNEDDYFLTSGASRST